MPWMGFTINGFHHGSNPLFVKPETPVPRREKTRWDVWMSLTWPTCTVALLATQDVAKMTDQGLVLLGRQDNAEVRGCSLLAAP